MSVKEERQDDECAGAGGQETSLQRTQTSLPFDSARYRIFQDLRLHSSTFHY